jgi:nitroimidazol reductase NimA-like FMN-containing flavoprotein (pyridoxamine 5'-phosphate oxidase superfamily)
MGKPIPEQEIRKLMDDELWGTLMAIDDGQPYAVETSFATDEENLYTGSKLGGRMHRCLARNPAASFKICAGDHRGHNYRAAIVESQAEILTSREDFLYCLKIIFTKLGLSTDTVEAKADTYAAGKGSLALYRLPLRKLGGIRSGRG